MGMELIKQLLDAGVHFGHQTRRWNPKMKKFIFGERSGIYVIDLEKTEACLTEARDFVRNIAAKGGRFLFVGTKKQAQEVVQQEAARAGMFYVNARWMGGLLTNFETVKKSIRKLQDIERMEKDGVFGRLTKKEISLLNKERVRLLSDLGGIREMTRLPEAVFVVDVKKEDIAIKECKRLNIPVIAMIDTNSDPDPIDCPIPANDDAVKSIRLIAGLVTDSIIEGRKEFAGHEAPAAEVVVEQTVPAAVVEGVVPQIILESLAEGAVELDETVVTKEAAKKKAVKKPVEKE
ncbi:MAG: 30S ribosomal protein S2 [Candidatus Omnitrophica bacterium]|nr:30S ribosomal protein S2 [Candidatus Omnitrophota bacterium]